MSGIPMLRLELTGLKEAIVMAFNERQVAQDIDVRAAVESFCQPERLQAIIGQAVQETLTKVIKDEVERFYTYGDGRQVVKNAVLQRLKRGETDLG